MSDPWDHPITHRWAEIVEVDDFASPATAAAIRAAVLRLAGTR